MCKAPNEPQIRNDKKTVLGVLYTRVHGIGFDVLRDYTTCPCVSPIFSI